MKKILAIAIAAGLAAPAMADTTLYGQLNASVDALSGADDITSVSSNSSRIGVKGSSDLNGGLKVIYQAEWGMDTGGHDNNALTKTSKVAITNRNQVVGIAGGFGAVLLGRHDTPVKIVGRKADLFWSTQLGQNRNIVNPGNWDLRPQNVIAYQSPKFGGAQILAAYVTDLGKATIPGVGVVEKDNDNNAFSINGFYNAGPLMLGAGYEKHNVGNLTSAGVDGIIGTIDDVANVDAGDRDVWRLMGSYKFGAAKVVGFYQTEDNLLQADADVWGLGASYKVSPNGTIKGQYYSRDIDGTSNDPTLIAVGYDHSLGKKTAIYAQYVQTDEGQGLGGAGHGEKVSADSSGDASGFSVGVRHKF